MFKKKDDAGDTQPTVSPEMRVTSVLGEGITWKGSISGRGGVRVEGAFEGEINLRGLFVVGASGRVTCEHVYADVVIVAGSLRGNITAEKVDIRSTGRVWGDVVTTAFSTEEGAFLRGQIRMEEQVELEAGQPAGEAETAPSEPS